MTEAPPQMQIYHWWVLLRLRPRPLHPWHCVLVLGTTC